MIGGDRVGNILQQNGFAGARRRNDQRALALADRGDDIDDPGREILLGWILILHLEPFVGIERGQVVKIDLVARLLRILEIDCVDLEQSEIALALFWRADMAFNCVSGAQAESANLAWRNINVVRRSEE